MARGGATDLFLEADDACPLFLEEADCAGGGVAGVKVVEGGVVLEGGEGVVHPRGVQVGEHRPVAAGGVSGAGEGGRHSQLVFLAVGQGHRVWREERAAGLFVCLVLLLFTVTVTVTPPPMPKLHTTSTPAPGVLLLQFNRCVPPHPPR